MKLKLSSHKVRPHRSHGDESWWYENAKSIDVYIRTLDPSQTLAVRIKRSALKDWLARTEPKAKAK